MSLTLSLVRLAAHSRPGKRQETLPVQREISFRTIAETAQRPGTRSWLVARAVSLRAF